MNGTGRLVTTLVVAWAATLPASAHIGSPDVVYDGHAGPYPVRVIIKTPGVVPGLAQISVRLGDEVSAERVLVRPVHASAGLEGSPPPDAARPVRGDEALYTAELWLMTSGSYSVYVDVEGRHGTGTAIVPVQSVATRRLGMHPGLGVLLVLLGLLLVSGLVRIAGAAVESTVPADAELDGPGRHRARFTMIGAFVVVALILWGGKTWWDNVDAGYLARMWDAYSIAASARTEGGYRVLELELDDERWQRAAPLAPDHGKLMHMFLVREPDLDAFAHLHPISSTGELSFAVTLPPLPAGSYRIYADVTHETGIAQTLTDEVELPEHAAADTEPFPAGLAPDPDDSWHGAGAVVGTTYPFSDGFQLAWQRGSRALRPGEETDLRFQLRTPDGDPAPLEPYMGMYSHAAVRRHDGEVFVHLHPTGTISMAAQELFARRGGEPETDHSRHRMALGDSGRVETVSMPYAFPRPGTYRVWAQVKSAGKVYTGVFDAEIRPGE